MATTTNYGWTTPDDTALVKDGAAAIRTLGSSVDTTTKALNPSTTLGDIEYRSSTANTNTRLGIGSTGNVLTVAGGVPTWAAPAAPPAPAFVGCMLYKGADQSISNGTTTAITFAATDYIDTDGYHDPSTNNSRITIPSGKGGKYLITTMAWVAAGAQGLYRVIIRVNGSSVLTTRGPIGNGSTNNAAPGMTTIYSLTAGDYIEFFLQQSTGFSADVYGDSYEESSKSTFFGVQFLGA
jgi:hypothetical protein